MTVPPESIRLPETFASAGDPIDVNPFPVEDTRHDAWRVATRAAEEEVCRFMAGALWPPPDDPLVWFLKLVSAKFNAWAFRGLHVVRSDADMRHYDRWLVRYANAWLDKSSQSYTSNPPTLPDRSEQTALRNVLGGLVEHWKAEARKYRAEQEASAEFCGKLETEAFARQAEPHSRPQVTPPEQSSTAARAAEPQTRRDRVNSFLERCNRDYQGPGKLLRTHIWTLARHKTARQFQRWQKCDEKATVADHQAFGRILEMTPQDFIEAITRRRRDTP